MGKNQALNIFFFCLGIDIVISVIRVNFILLNSTQIINNVFLSFLYNFIIGIPAGISGMVVVLLSAEIIERIKKNEKNEVNFYQHFLVQYVRLLCF